MDKTYNEGLIEGEINAVKDMQKTQNRRLDNHSSRLSNLERVSYLMIGAILFIEFFPQLKVFFEGG